MTFKERIIFYETEKAEEIYINKKGYLPVILTAVHTMEQTKEDGATKLREPFTKAIVKYVAEETDSSYLIKQIDTGIDSNSFKVDEFKLKLLNLIKENNIKLLFDIHGAKKDREFDIELGTLNNLSADFSTIKELKEAFTENGINKIEINNPFKGGGITQYIYEETDIDVIQIEINQKYRDLNNIDNIEKVCNSLIRFINQYTEKR